nr:uncharacterized protein LOC128684076 [Cherax quadricarinatus]
MTQVKQGQGILDIITTTTFFDNTARGRPEESRKERVLVMQKSGTPSSESYARLVKPFPRLGSFTICYRIMLLRFREESTLISYASSSDEDNGLRIGERRSYWTLYVYMDRSVASYRFTRSWATFLLHHQNYTSSWAMYLDGQLGSSGTFLGHSSPLQAGGAFIIGQEQDFLGGGFQRDQSFSGMFSQLSIWDGVLDPHTIRQVWLCEEQRPGNQLSWSSSSAESWKIHGEVTWETMSPSDLCRATSRYLVVFPDRFTLGQAKHLCNVVGGQVLVPANQQENSWVYESTQKVAARCSGGEGASYLWLGAADAAQERLWTYLGTGLPIKWEGPWRGGGPNGGTQENCLVMLYGDFPALWSDIACLESYSFCAPCEFTQLETMYLKGPALCNTSPFNYQYLLGGQLGDGRPSLTGFYHSDIFWENNTWYLQSLKDREAKAWWTPGREGMYPFGTRPWTLGVDVCGLSPGTVVNLTLSACREGQFTCVDGSCIDLTKRCDLRIDCKDESDEAECSLLDIPLGYRTVIPPPPVNGSQSLEVSFSIKIIAFPKIATQDLVFTVTFLLCLRWKDIRLNFHNLKKDRTLNLLSRESVQDIWTPLVFFSNAQGNVFTNHELGSRVECVREGPSRPGPRHLPDEVNVFSGHENSLEMRQLYTSSYSCDFDLIRFPFDSQCSRRRHDKLTERDEPTTGEVNMERTHKGEQEFSSMQVEVKFIRRYNFYLLTLYIPTTLLIFIAYATFFFNPDDFNSRITVAITSLLVLTSLFTQTSNALPKTSYFKLIDVWLFFSIVIIFLVILLQTLVNFSKPAATPRTHVTHHPWLTRLASKLMYGSTRPLQVSTTVATRPEGGEEVTSLRRDHNDQTTTYDQESDTVLSYTKNDSSGIPQTRPYFHKRETTRFERPSLRQRDSQVEDRRKTDAENSLGHRERQQRSIFGSWFTADTQNGVNMSLMVKSRVLLPIIFVVFNMCYWGIAFSNSNASSAGTKQI